MQASLHGSSNMTSYEIIVYTGDKSNAGTDSKVYITLFGNHGKQTEKIHLKNSNNKDPFERKQIDIFRVQADYIEELTKLRIEHDNTGRGPGWFLDRIIVTDLNNPTTKYIAICNKWLAKDEDDRQISRDLILNKQTSEIKRNNQYNITIYTGKKTGAGTDANVFITLYGNLGETTSIKLDSKKKSFEAGQKDEFIIECPTVGEIHKILIAHDNKGSAPGWFLDRILIEDLKNNHLYEFPCNKWLAKDEDDKQISRILFPKKPVRNNQYKITVFTGKKPGAGTDADVFITLYGNLGETTPINLDNKNNNFEAGKKDEFIIECPTIGEIHKILIAHDNKGSAPGWFLDRILIEDLKNNHLYEFPCNKWLAKDEDDKQISRILFPKKPVRNNQYKITVFTGKKPGAGTDADVFITLYGNLGETTPINLDNKNNNFEAGKKDEFIIECPTVGEIHKILIAHNNKGSAPGWFLDRILIEDLKNNHLYEFPCNKWLAKDEDDKQISRFLFPKKSPDHPKEPIEGVTYIITVYTGDKKNAGTDARVYIVMHGKNSSSSQILLTDGKFENKSIDKFTTDDSIDLSPLTALDIGHDNSGVGAAWFLDKVVVDCPRTGIKQTFPCYNWLDNNQGDKCIERRLKEDLSLRKTRPPTVPWYIWVYTSDIKQAGTNAQVIIVLYGNHGKSINIKLERNSDTLQQAHCDQFKVDINDVGIPFKLRVSINNKYLSHSWHLDRIEMINIKTNEEYRFYCRRWLSKTEDDKQLIRELPAEGAQILKALPIVKYIVDIYTGNKPNADTDANLFINIYGEYGDTGVRPLEYSLQNKKKFQRNQVDSFIIEAVLLKELRKIHIGHDGTGIDSQWFLNKVVIRSEDQPYQPVTFICDRWLSINKNGQQIICELTPTEYIDQTIYYVKIKTGDVFQSGTDANVHLQIFGEKSQTDYIQLNKINYSINRFQCGSIDMFTIQYYDLGKITHIRIGHDGTSYNPAWFIDWIDIDVPKRREIYRFVCNRWLDKKEGDGRIECDLKPTEVIKTHIQYEITIFTGDKIDAGTDENIFIQIFGLQNKTEEIILEKKIGSFQKNSIDKFLYEAVDVGKIEKIRIGIISEKLSSTWYLEKILIQRHLNQSFDERKRTFCPHIEEYLFI
ncbi:unnamed protein product, partial [Rotaria sp. Silwood1]